MVRKDIPHLGGQWPVKEKPTSNVAFFSLATGLPEGAECVDNKIRIAGAIEIMLYFAAFCCIMYREYNGGKHEHSDSNIGSIGKKSQGFQYGSESITYRANRILGKNREMRRRKS
jgi:hypothetical protein